MTVLFFWDILELMLIQGRIIIVDIYEIFAWFVVIVPVIVIVVSVIILTALMIMNLIKKSKIHKRTK